jgi:hypothetical protein
MNNDFKLDMTMMFAIHDAFRRDLREVTQMGGRSPGWDLFERMLHIHHTVEDDVLWPLVRNGVTGQRDDLVLLDEMAAEHAALDPLVDAIDAALAGGDSAAQAGADLAARLERHLAHEEEAGLALVDRTLSEEQWMSFGQSTAEQVGPDMPRFLPWVLDGATPERTALVLGALPEPVQATYRDEWQPAYADTDWWAT